eukprot:9100442-Pyramimonas_sp.AAC.2
MDPNYWLAIAISQKLVKKGKAYRARSGDQSSRSSFGRSFEDFLEEFRSFRDEVFGLFGLPAKTTRNIKTT